MLQWSHDLAVVETRACGNPDENLEEASMEPRPCGRGNTVREIIEAALAQLQWSHDLAVVETIEPIPLEEFGPFASMEPRPCGRGNFQQALVQAAAQKASMEPRPCGRGNIHAYTHPLLAVLLLQWSHDLAVVET